MYNYVRLYWILPITIPHSDIKIDYHAPSWLKKKTFVVCENVQSIIVSSRAEQGLYRVWREGYFGGRCQRRPGTLFLYCLTTGTISLHESIWLSRPAPVMSLTRERWLCH